MASFGGLEAVWYHLDYAYGVSRAPRPRARYQRSIDTEEVQDSVDERERMRRASGHEE